ncbi:RDD family protein [Caldimonas brevitalea]|uniref:RDD domain-containing protein n=1 Tax=Caldimonas brevitalea TaxID=413882 RepID=A0A0G3BIE2_9BURK|nr:RDD family protein [Caldimonas brevitalea]AKJ29132.1 hypothetical protein AAW51_2441 [Caldimonas brevitalea]
MQQLKEHDRHQDTEELPETARQAPGETTGGVWQTVLSAPGVPEVTPGTTARTDGVRDAQAEADAQPHLASLPRRALAYAIDVCGCLSLAAVVLLPLRAVSESAHVPIFLAVWLTYFLLRDSIPGLGLGKRLMGIRTVQVDSGRSCTWPQSVTRNVTHVFLLLDAVFVLGRSRRRLGDYIAGTVVVPLRR